MALDAAGLLWLAIALVLAIPIAWIIAAGTSFARRGQWRLAGVAAAILVVIAIAIASALLAEPRRLGRLVRVWTIGHRVPRSLRDRARIAGRPDHFAAGGVVHHVPTRTESLSGAPSLSRVDETAEYAPDEVETTPVAPARRRPAPTMRDVGNLAGVSQSVVSRVLNNAPGDVRIPAKTRERVWIAARKLGYRPNPLARGLRGAQTMLIGTVVSDITDPFFNVAIEALSVACISRGYNLVLGHAHDRFDEALAVAGILETRHCDAIVLLGDIQDQPRLFADLADSVVPLVGLLQGSGGTEMPLVGVDNNAGIVAAMDHLVGLGHREIALVSGHRTGDIRERHDAFVEFMRGQFGYAATQIRVEFGDNTPSGGDEAARRLFGRPDRPTAIMCTNDTMAIGVLHAANALGIRVPGDVSVHGFDDMALAAHLVPSLTTIRIPMKEMAEESVERAIELATGRAIPTEKRVRLFQPSLVMRESTSAPPQPA